MEPVDLSVAIYLRKSRSDLEAEARGEGETLSRHKRVLLQLAKEHQFYVLALYQEIVSGDQLADRPQAQKMLWEVAQGKFHAILCMDLDRLGRGNLIDQGIIQQALKKSGTLVITPRKIYDLRDEWDEEWSEFEAFFARRELKMITRRLQRGRRFSASEGNSISQHPPYGYLRQADLKLTPDPVTATVVKRIFELAKNGISRTAIARLLNSQGIPAPRGGLWGASTITFILQNPVYQGTIVWGKHRYLKSGHTYHKETVPRELWIIKDGAHEPLIEETELHAIWQSNEKDAHAQKRTEHIISPLSGLIRCYHCQRPLQFRKSYGKRDHRLLCVTSGCPTKSTSFTLVYNALMERLTHFITFASFSESIIWHDSILNSGYLENQIKSQVNTQKVIEIANLLKDPRMEPKMLNQLLRALVDRVVYRRDQEWPAEHPVDLEIWMKI